MVSQTWVKPFSAAWRARGYFAFAIIFWIMSETIKQPFPSAPDLEWWKILLNKGVGSFDKIADAVFLAGLVYAVASDIFEYVWNSSLQPEVRQGFNSVTTAVSGSLASFASNLVGLSFEAVKVWVEGGKGRPDQMRAIGVSSLKGYYGPHTNSPDNLIDFVIDDITDNSGFDSSQTWGTYITNSTIRSCSIPDHFEWEERKNYDIICGSGSGTIPIGLEMSFRIKSNHISEVMDGIEYTVRLANSAYFDLREWWKVNKTKVVLQERFDIEDNNVTLSYDGTYLTIQFLKDYAISARTTPVYIYEKSYISQDDRCYVLALRHPTKNLQSSLTIDVENWAVKSPVISARLYKQGKQIVLTENPHGRTTAAHVRGWTLPGLAVVMEWTPTH